MLVDANFIKMIRLHIWIADPFLVKTSIGKCCVCVDFRDLNKACPKDCYPLPQIYQLVDTTSGHGLLIFTNACSGYNQIKIEEMDASHTPFYVDNYIYQYTVMLFRLIHAGAIGQRMVNKLFLDMIGDTMEAYVYEMLVESEVIVDHQRDLEHTFARMKLQNV